MNGRSPPVIGERPLPRNRRESAEPCDEISKLSNGPLSASVESAVPPQVLKAEVAAWAKRIGVQPREVHVRIMKRKWASCSTRGRLTFDTELLTQPAAFRAEVIVHELLHLKVPNHGKTFRSLLRAYLAKVTNGDGVLNGRHTATKS